MKFKLLLLSCVLMSSQTFAQSIFKQTNAAPVEDRVITKKIESPKVDSVAGENIPNNCIGHGGNWANCIPVETSGVTPQSTLTPQTLSSMSIVSDNSVSSPVKTGIETKVDDKEDKPLALAAYPDNIKKYRDSNGVWNFTNDESSIKPGVNAEKVDLNKLPAGKKGEMPVKKKAEEVKKVSEKKIIKK